MKKQDLQNEQLDRIGRNIVRAATMRDDEIERIVSAPQLFDSIKARIKTEEASRKSKNVFSDWKIFQIRNWQMTSAALAVIVICLSIVINVFVFKKQDSRQVLAEQIAAPELQSQTPEVAGLSDSTTDVLQSSETENSITKSTQKVSFKMEKPALRKPVRKLNSAKSQPSRKNEEIEGDFYRLMFAGNSEETSEDEQLIRVELPHASLVALGVNPPVKNENEKVKTDLLIGSDGVVRAVRFIK